MSDSSQLSDWLTEAWPKDGSLTSPKLTSPAAPRRRLYRYYAGYADKFVADVVARLPRRTGNVLDPWNGSGTTTSVAAAHGIAAQGFDLNPAAVVISKARLLQSNIAPSLLPLARELLGAIETDAAVADDDLLLRWMTKRGAGAVRRLAATIDRALVETGISTDAAQLSSEMSPLAALFYLALFRSVREALTKFEGSNPTWIRQSVNEQDKVDIDLRTLRPSLLRTMSELTTVVKSLGMPDDPQARVKVAVADSADLPLADDGIDAVISSPPYCTRIDYAVATLPELAVLGMRADQLRALRDQLIGTPTRNGSPEADLRWGMTATRFLRQVAEHSSHASGSYYSSFFTQYFGGMWRSLSEIGRVVAPGRPIVLVVQDSHYKELHADVPGMISEMAATLGWDVLARRDFQVKTKATINTKTRKYRRPTSATEAVLAFSR